jgi:hypothetical protein
VVASAGKASGVDTAGRGHNCGRVVDPDKQLAPVDARVVADEYERDYMRGEGMVLYRDKTRSPWQLHAIIGTVATMMIASAIFAPGGWIGAAVGLPLLTLIWLLFSVLRVTVSQGHVNIQLGLFGPKIPIPAIESAEPLAYDWKQFGGWGIRLNRQGEWMYNLPGDGGRAVKIVWRDRKGRRKVTYVASREAEQVAHAIAQAQAALPEARTKPALPE